MQCLYGATHISGCGGMKKQEAILKVKVTSRGIRMSDELENKNTAMSEEDGQAISDFLASPEYAKAQAAAREQFEKQSGVKADTNGVFNGPRGKMKLFPAIRGHAVVPEDELEQAKLDGIDIFGFYEYDDKQHRLLTKGGIVSFASCGSA